VNCQLLGSQKNVIPLALTKEGKQSEGPASYARQALTNPHRKIVSAHFVRAWLQPCRKPHEKRRGFSR
jgi:hypothetical protein